MEDKASIEPKPGDILIVDDTPANLNLLAGMLKQHGYLVRPVPNGKLALLAAEMQPPDIIMLDINMPEMDGFEVCQRLKADPRLRSVPVIFISALTETLDKVKAFSAGGVDYVTKPFQFEEVEARIETHLKLRRYQAQVESWTLQLADKVRAQTFEIHARNEKLAALVEKIQKDLDDTIMAFSSVMELRHPRMAGHASNVAELSERVANLSGAPNLPAVRTAALLHDIGKLGFSDSLLQKNPNKLTPDEFQQYVLHPVRGQVTLDRVDDLHEASLLIRSHHENYDGSGFPDGLRREAIPAGSRIIGMADYLDWSIQSSLEKENPIRAGLSALKMALHRKFDPSLYQWFEAIAEEYYAKIIPKRGESLVEVTLKELAADMILGKDLWSSSGILLLRKGSQMNEACIQSLHRRCSYDPPKDGIYISVEDLSLHQ